MCVYSIDHVFYVVCDQSDLFVVCTPDMEFSTDTPPDGWKIKPEDYNNYRFDSFVYLSETVAPRLTVTMTRISVLMTNQHLTDPEELENMRVRMVNDYEDANSFMEEAADHRDTGLHFLASCMKHRALANWNGIEWLIQQSQRATSSGKVTEMHLPWTSYPKPQYDISGPAFYSDGIENLTRRPIRVDAPPGRLNQLIRALDDIEKGISLGDWPKGREVEEITIGIQPLLFEAYMSGDQEKQARCKDALDRCKHVMKSAARVKGSSRRAPRKYSLRSDGVASKAVDIAKTGVSTAVNLVNTGVETIGDAVFGSGTETPMEVAQRMSALPSSDVKKVLTQGIMDSMMGPMEKEIWYASRTLRKRRKDAVGRTQDETELQALMQKIAQLKQRETQLIERISGM